MDQDDMRTVYCGNVSDKVTEELLYELFLQVAPLEKIRIPKDRAGTQQSFAFITFKHQASVDYAINLLQGISIFDRSLNLKPRGSAAQQTNNRSQQNHNQPQQQQQPYTNRNNDQLSQELDRLQRMGNQLIDNPRNNQYPPQHQRGNHNYDKPYHNNRNNSRNERDRRNSSRSHSYNQDYDRDRHHRNRSYN